MNRFELLGRKFKYYSHRLLAIFAISVFGFSIGTFYPNFITKNHVEHSAVNKTVNWMKELGFGDPKILTGTDEQFITTMKNCISWINLELNKNERIPDELIIAQAIIESNAGLSRFAVEGNNLFGIRIFSKNTGMLPKGYDESLPWRVKSYVSKCACVRDYINILNTKGAYKQFRKIRDRQNSVFGKIDAIELASGLDNWSTTKDYEDQVISIIKKLREDNKVIIKRRKG